jgi:tetrapyrrole methylase family protein / MazG family protein
MSTNQTSADQAFRELYDIIIKLRSPDGCPWDREQTPQSLRRHLLEETYECIEAVESGSPSDVEEELGDVYMLVTIIARMYEEAGDFTLVDVLRSVAAKLVRRHPHVFNGTKIASADEVVAQWNQIKTEAEGKPAATGLLDAVSRAMPSLERAHALQRVAAKVGFDWPSLAGVREKLLEELDEVIDEAGGDAALEAPRLEHGAGGSDLEGEVGDLLFSAINVARYLGVDPSIALNRANAKFTARFRDVELRMAELGNQMEPAHFEVMDELWNRAKDSL